MTRKDISDGVGNISTRHIQEAASYMAAEKKVSFFKKPFGRSMIAAVLALCILAGGIRIFSPFGGMVVTAYAHGTDEEITQAGAVINTGTISDSGEMTGHPLMFYLSGKDISTVRFSCKNQRINFMDWTEKRDEFGLAQNFTVSLLEDGTFFAKFDDYEITAEDSFIDRPDSEAIGAAPVIEDNYKEADPNEPEQIVIPNSITFTGTIIDNVIESLVPIILVDVEENSGLSYDKVLFELTEEQKDWELKIGTRVQIVCSDIFQESTPPIGNLISITEAAPNDELKIADEAARAYYENTVFEVVSLELKSQTENEISFSVCVSKGGIVQEPDRTIILQLVNNSWEVVNEGY